jgi:hypothetical protein
VEYTAEFYFNVPTKEVKRKHIKEQMHVVFVNKARCQKPIVFLSCRNEVGIHDHATYGGRIVKGEKAD